MTPSLAIFIALTLAVLFVLYLYDKTAEDMRRRDLRRHFQGNPHAD